MANFTGTSGDDSLTGTSSNDTLSGLDGDDTLVGLDRNDVLDGGAGNDTLLGGSGADTLNGGDGDDFIDPGINNDTIDGGAGNDTVTYENSGNNIALNVDLTTGFAYLNVNTTETITNVENIIGSNTAVGDVITGDAADNSFQGLAGTDTLFGGAGSDTLDGGADNDVLDGGTGDDTLTGGDGSDLFVWDGSSSDVITDFGVGNTGATGDDGVDSYTGDNDFIDLTSIFNASTLAAYNAAAGTSFATAFGAMNDDIADGVIDFNGTDFTGPSLTLTGRTSLETDETGRRLLRRGHDDPDRGWRGRDREPAPRRPGPDHGQRPATRGHAGLAQAGSGSIGSASPAEAGAHSARRFRGPAPADRVATTCDPAAAGQRGNSGSGNASRRCQGRGRS